MNVLTWKTGLLSLLAAPRIEEGPSRDNSGLEVSGPRLTLVKWIKTLTQFRATGRSGGRLVVKKELSHNWGTFCTASTPALRHWKLCIQTVPATWHWAPNPVSSAALVSREWMAEHVASRPTWYVLLAFATSLMSKLNYTHSTCGTVMGPVEFLLLFLHLCTKSSVAPLCSSEKWISCSGGG